MQCTYCDGEISETSRACRHCGRSTALGKKESSAKRTRLILMVIGIPIGLFILAIVIGLNAPQDIKATTRAEAAVRGHLLDPGSATFGPSAYHNGTVCGVVNAKNRMGGYTGDVRYIVLDGGVTFIESDNDRYFSTVWIAKCIGGATQTTEPLPPYGTS